MAQRPVYMSRLTPPYCFPWNAEFVFNPGFSPTQKQKNITAIHRVFSAEFPELKVLEISSKSMQEGGVELSAFHLPKYVPSLGKSVPVENVFQAGKVFQRGGPYTDLLHVSPRDAKRDERLRSSGLISGFRFEGRDFPILPRTAFYDYLYINALLENERLADIVLSYDAFTDIEFNPERSVNCQAKAAALFVALHKLNKLEEVRDFDRFLAVLGSTAPQKPAAPKQVVLPKSAPVVTAAVQPGDVLVHKVWGPGTVLRVTPTIVSVRFTGVGEKNLGLSWALSNCAVRPK